MDGQPGAVLRDADGKVVSTRALDIADGRLQTVRTVTNPDKLRHLGPVGDAWAFLRASPGARPAPAVQPEDAGS